MTQGEWPDVDLLADLDAGVLDTHRAAQVRTAALADPRAVAVLAALAATRADLADLPVPPVPAGVADRWAAALETAALEGTTRDTAGTDSRRSARSRPPGPWRPATAGRPRAGRPGRERPPVRRGPARIAAGILAVLVTAAVTWWSAGQAGTEERVERVDLAALGRSALGVGDVGGLADTARRAGCLRAVAPAGIEPAAPLLGGRQVELDGRRGVLLVLGTGKLGAFRVVVVDPGCGPGGGVLLGSVALDR